MTRVEPLVNSHAVKLNLRAFWNFDFSCGSPRHVAATMVAPAIRSCARPLLPASLLPHDRNVVHWCLIAAGVGRLVEGLAA